jgi:hypothetical protein
MNLLAEQVQALVAAGKVSAAAYEQLRRLHEQEQREQRQGRGGAGAFAEADSALGVRLGEGAAEADPLAEAASQDALPCAAEAPLPSAGSGGASAAEGGAFGSGVGAGARWTQPPPLLLPVGRTPYTAAGVMEHQVCCSQPWFLGAADPESFAQLNLIPRRS